MTKKLVLAFSGGVDSAVAAELLRQSGYEVHALHLLIWGNDEKLENVKALADQLQIPLDFMDVKSTFREIVVQPFIDAYIGGLTPSPCLFCNPQIKWQSILKFADQIGAEFVATGHYARLVRTPDNLIEIWKARDEQKDQSYMLTFLDQSSLSRTFLPLGDYKKAEIRQIAASLGLSVSNQPDSQDLCFLAGSNYRDFLADHSNHPPQPGPIYDRSGKLLGQHQGLAYYTIGQRKGLPAASQALYVLEKNLEGNSLIVGFKSELGADQFYVGQLNWISGKAPAQSTQIEVKIRYQAVPVKATLEIQNADKVLVTASRQLRDISPGQIAAFYQGNQLLGGGVILSLAQVD